MCELCENDSTTYDKDLTMWLCGPCYGSFNGNIVEVELDEVW